MKKYIPKESTPTKIVTNISRVANDMWQLSGVNLVEVI
jgi:hypothetical protein